MRSENIILIGMPGAGKSTVGVLLAKALGMSFVDTDLIIQERTGSLLQEIINERGLQGFLGVEAEAICSRDYHNCVVATGGSAVFSPNAMELLKSGGVAVYLKLPCVELEGRLGNLHTRGVVMKSGEGVGDLLAQREPYYVQYADKTVDCADLSPEETVSAIIKACGL